MRRKAPVFVATVCSLASPASADVDYGQTYKSGLVTCFSKAEHHAETSISFELGAWQKQVRQTSEGIRVVSTFSVVSEDEAGVRSRWSAESFGRSSVHFPHTLKLYKNDRSGEWTGQLNLAPETSAMLTSQGPKDGAVKGAVMIWPVRKGEGFYGSCKGSISIEKTMKNL